MQERSYRVLMIAPTSFFADYGCHVRILEEARILQKLGHHVTLVTYHNGGNVAGLDIRRTLPIPWRRDYEVGSSRHKIGLDALLGVKTLEILARERFDVIHAHLHEGALIGIVAGALSRAPVLFDYQGSMTAEMIDHHFLRQNSRVHRWLGGLEHWIDDTVPVVLTSSTQSQERLLGSVKHPERVEALADCVNPDVFLPAECYDPAELAALRASLGVPPDRRLIVYLGLLAEYQGTGLLLQALRRLVDRRKDVHLLLMGFPALDYYQAQAEELGIRSFVSFTGRVPYERAPIHLALGDVAAAPKLSLTEGAGKILNYMATGLPVVAFDTPVAREYLGQDGLLAEPGDVEGLAEELYGCLYPRPELAGFYQGLGQRLRQRAVACFSWEASGRQIVEMYRRLR